METKNYESLKDPHLNEYFNNKRIRRHLIKAGFINQQGEILPAASQEDVLARRAKRKQTRAKLSYTITNYILEKERKREMFLQNQYDLALKRARVKKIRESKFPPRRAMSYNVLYLTKHSKPRNARTPSPVHIQKSVKHSPIRPKSAHPHPVINAKNQVIRRPATAKQSLNDDECQVTMIYYGPPKTSETKKSNADEILVMQQHCGGENLMVFKGFVRPNETFSFDSRRHPDYPFALAIYINGLIDSRISVCCEYKHKHNVRLGSKYGLFGIFDVQKSQPCRFCRFEQRKKKILSNISLDRKTSPYRRSILTNNYQPGVLLRTPTTSPEREKPPSKKSMNRVSTVAQASISPRTLSSTSSSHHKEEPKTIEKSSTPDNNNIINNNDSKKSSRRTSTDTYSKIEEPHHSSEPILSKKDIDENSSNKSGVSPIRYSDNDDTLELEKENTNGHATRSQSSSSSSSGAIKNNDKQVVVPKSSSSSSSASIRKNDKQVLSKSSSSASSRENENQVVASKSSSSSSTTLKRPDSLSPDSFSEEEDVPLDFKPVPKDDEIERTTSQNSKKSNSSELKVQSNENVLSRSSSTSDTANHHLLVSEKKSDSSSETSENKDRRPSISSFDSQLTDDIIPMKNPIKLNTDDQDIKSKEEDDDEEILATLAEPEKQYYGIENIIVAWLDADNDNLNHDNIHFQKQLRQITRTLRLYSNPNQCLESFKDIKNDKIFLIVSGSLSQTILERINDYPQLVCIYIFCQNKSKYEYLLNEYQQIKGIYTDIYNLCAQLHIDIKQWNNDLNTFQITSKLSSESNVHSQQLVFLQNQLFKQYLLDINYNENSKTDFLDYCKQLYIENDQELELIQEFNENYNSNYAIEWFIKDCFISHILNRALRMKDIKTLFQIGFFIKDIHQQIENDYSDTVHRSTITVYRSQGINMEYLNELKENSNGFLSFNNFLLTTKKQSIAYEYAQRSLTNGFPIAVIFRIKINPKTTITSFTNTDSEEFDILLSFKSIFSIEKLDEIENNLWQIDLILTDEIFSLIENENDKYNYLNNDLNDKFGELLIDMNEFNSAKDFYELNLINNNNKSLYIYKQLGFIYSKLYIYDQAILYYNLALATESNEYDIIANIYNELGKIFYIQNRISEALEKFREALNIQLENLSPDDISLNNTYNLLAMIYEEMNDYETALICYRNQLHIHEQATLTKQTELALIHFKIASCLENLNRYDQAFDHIQKSIDMSSPDDIELNERQLVLERIREQIQEK